MPEDAHTTLQGLLSKLEELQNSPEDAIYIMNSEIMLNLISINTFLSSSDEISSTDADRVLKVCLQYKLDIKCAPYILSIISSLINIDKIKPFVPAVDFLQTALGVLEFLKSKCIDDKTRNLRILSFQVLVSHPLTALVKLVNSHCPLLIETLGLFLDSSYTDAKTEPFILLQLLHLLPPAEKSMFVKEGIPIWLAKLFPSLMRILLSLEDKEKIEMCLSYTDILTEQLVLHNYFEDHQWQYFLESVADVKKFPICIKNLLESGKDTWHRIWIFIVRLLKNHITKNFGSFGTPINSMLPVVESAFKRDSTQRVRAFACWEELILNFSNETNPNCIGKRIKLVLIPLRLNNAKTEDTALAKFYTWWLLIRKFKPQLKKHTSEILVPFLQFVFGKRQNTKLSFWAGQLSNDMKKKCLEAFVEMVGHSDCDSSCTSTIEPLNGKVITTVMLADYWKDWVYSLKTAVNMVARMYNPEAKKNIRCIWKSFILQMTELLDNSMRRDWFDELINLLLVFVQESVTYSDLSEIIIEDLTLPLFKDNRIYTLLSSRNQEYRPMHRIVIIITGKFFDSYYKRFSPQDLSTMLEPLVSTLVTESVTTPAYLIWLLDELPLTEGALKLWTVLVRKVTDSDLCLQVFNTLLRWPFNTLNAVIDVKDAALAWYTLYNVVHVKLDKTGFDNAISKLLTKPVEDSKAANYFILFALIGVLKHKPNEDKMAKLEALTYEMTDYENFEPLIPSLVDTLALMIDNSSTKEYENLAQITMNCVNNVLKLINNNTKIEDVPSISSEIASSEVRVNFPVINKSVLNNIITTSMKKYLPKCTNESIKKEIRNIISSLEKTDEKPAIESPKKTAAVKEFTSPKVKDVKNKKKELSIVNTVVENGEEYVVVKSNWKFNPKNLTENQKEKLQRKRDIPALYQDLSQSQDEFKLMAWKPDSQDTSLSSSKSASNSDATEILKNMSSTDVVPKIMENILENANKTQKTNVNTSPGPVLLKVDKVVTPKGTKSPRMALKDRVFRNVRNLIEKSSPSPMIEVKEKQDLIILDDVPKSPTIKLVLEITHKKDELSQIANVIKSTAPKSATDDNVIDKQENQNPNPKSADENNDNKLTVVTSKQDDQNITSICTPVTKRQKDKNITKPSLLSTERPARMKRKPKKFDDSLLLAFKRNRHSNNESQSDSQDSQDSPYVLPEITVAQVHTKENNDITNIDQADKIVTAEDVEATKKDDEDETRTASTNDVKLLDDEKLMDCVKETGDTTPHTFENTVVITPTTPISDKTEKSPEKPSNIVEVPSDKDKASEGIGNGAAQILTKEANEDLAIAKTPLNKLKEVNEQKSSVKRNRARNDSDDKQVQIIKTPLTRKAKVLVEKRITPEQAPSLVIRLCDIIKGPNQEISKKSVVENETIIDDLKSDALSTPINKTNITKDANQQKSTKTDEQNINQNDEKSECGPTNEIKEINLPKSAIKRKDAQTEDNKNKNINPVTPKNKGKDAGPQSSVKKTAKKSRIEKELMIDMVEGHPFLKAQSEKRLTRRKILEVENSNRRKTEKLNKAKLEATPKTTKNTKEKKISTNKVIVEDSQDRSNSVEDAVMDEPPCSEDIIESSQDSTITTISVKSTKRTPKRQLLVTLEKIATETQDLIQDCEMIDLPNEEFLEKTDIELPQNKTAEVDKDTTHLTENMDTEPMDENNVSDEVIVLDETQPFPITINSEPVIGPETQEIAEADTQPNDPKDFVEFGIYEVNKYQPPFKKAPEKHIGEEPIEETNITQTLPEVNTANDDTNKVLSPFKDENERKQDFLNNTLEISPIKIQSPDREKEYPSPEASSDFVVIKLSSPVHSNGEPFEQHGSPEFFTEDKISPDKRDASPPIGEVTVTNTSPSSSLSLKKNRPQVRPGGRAAQMLGLCVNSDLKVPKAPERIEPEESKKCSMPARRNLRILYNSVGDNDPPENAEEAEHFLKLKRSLPTVTSSPSGPILKRKLIDIADETTASPASKRKRVSFHDPPVSTTISVYKYIEPLSMVRSPQSSAKKRQERQTRFGIKSPKRLENAFTSLLGVLDSALSKTVESFTETTPTDDTQNVSLDITPIVEVVKTSELNDTDPFYPDLVDCKDPIDVIATELSSPTTRELFIKELEGKVETVGDLAKMTELEIHRLCIKAPKIKVAKKVLSDFATKRPATELVETVIEEAFSEPMTESLLNKTADIEMQTDVVDVSSAEIQTDIQALVPASTQTENVSTAHTRMQTDEYDMTTEEIVSTCLVRENFIGKFTEKLDEESIKTIAEKLPTKSLLDLVVMKSDSSTLLNSLLKYQSKGLPNDKRSSAELSLVRDFLCERYESRDLILLCSQMLQNIHDKSDKPA